MIRPKPYPPTRPCPTASRSIPPPHTPTQPNPTQGNEAARKEELSVMQGQVYNALTTAGKFEGELLGTKHELRSSETLVQWLQKIVACKIPPE